MALTQRERELWLSYGQAAKDAGCPDDQFLNYARAGFILTAKQLQFAAACRMADLPDGPTQIGYGGARGGGKQIKTSEIMDCWTSNGFERLPAYRIKVGDSLIGSNGRLVRVLARSIPEVRQFYRLQFDDGTSLETSDNHLWTVIDLKHRGPGQSERGHCFKTVETQWLASQELRYRSGRRFALPMLSNPVELNDPVAPSLPPWLLGYWLGNGCKQASTLTCHSDDQEEILSYAEKELGVKLKAKIYDTTAKRSKILLKGWNQRLQSVGWPSQWHEAESRRYRTFDKETVHIEWRGWSVANRIQLLNGLLDSDGTVIKDGSLEFDSSDMGLADLVRELLQSLGHKPTRAVKRIPKNAEWSEMYRVKCIPLRPLFRLNRKARLIRSTNRTLRTTRRYLVSIEKAQHEEGICFAVDADDHLYVAGPNYILTHNSASLIAQIGLDDCQRRPQLKALILRKAVRANLENFQDNRLKIFGRIPHRFAPSKGIMTFDNGSRIVMGHFQNDKDIDNYLGLEYDVIGIEEATTLTSRKLKDIETCCRTSKQDWRPRMYSNTNPGGISHSYFKSRFILPYRAKAETTTRFIPAMVTDNPWNNPDYVKVLDNLTGWQKRAWRFGDWEIAAGQYFTNFRIETHVTPAETFDTRRAVEWFMGFDYGFNHYTVFLLGCVDGDGNTFILDEHAERGWLPERHASAVKAMLGRHAWRVEDDGTKVPLEIHHISRISAGPDVFSRQSDGTTVAAQYQEHGIKLQMGHVDRVNGWAEIIKLLGDDTIRPRLFIHPRCRLLVETLPQMVHDDNRPEDVLKVDVDEDGNGGDDAPDALRVLVATKKFKLQQVKLGGF